MNRRCLSASSLLLGLLLLGAVGCGANKSIAQTSAQSSQTETTSHRQAAPQAEASLQHSETAAEPTVVASETLSSSATNGAIQRDYESTAPLPSTGQVTIRDDIRNLELDQLITNCPTDSSPYAFAESTNYRVQICSQEYDPWLPKYYIGVAKDSSGELKITNTDAAEARQLIFKNAGYTYLIDRDEARPEQLNAYLEVYTPNGDNYAEALLYLYENNRPPR
jgi:CMP-N-acetylneuraminic acid synthetase